MKNLIFFCLLTLSLIACQDSSTPTGITKQFLDCLANGEFDKAKQFCTPQGAAAIDVARQMAKEGVPLINNYKIQRDSIAGDVAWVYYENTLYGRPYKAYTQLVKVDGKWKIHASPSK
jgi:hypothetical protein